MASSPGGLPGDTRRVDGPALARGGLTGTIGLVLSESLDNPLFAELTELLRFEAARRGHVLVVMQSDGDPRTERQRVLELERADVTGVVVISVLSDAQLASVASSRRGLPTVLVGRQRGAAGYSTVAPDYVSGAYAAVEHLIGHGHTEIAMVSGSSVSDLVEPRETGWRAAQIAAGSAIGPIGRGHFTRDAGHRIAAGLLTLRRRPTAVFAASDQIGLGVLRACHELGLCVPDDVAIASFDGTRAAEYAWPSLTSARQPLDSMAKAIIGRLFDLNAPTSHQVFPTTMSVGRSCGCHDRGVARFPTVEASAARSYGSEQNVSGTETP